MSQIKSYKEVAIAHVLMKSGSFKVRSCISKKHFGPGGMAQSERMRSVRAIRDIPVVADSAPGANTTTRVAYCPPLVVSPFPPALSFFYFKWTLRRCGQLWLYVGLGSSCTRLHHDFNAMGDAAKTSPHVPSTCAQNAIPSLLIIHIVPSRQIYVAIENPSRIPSISCLTTSSNLCNYVHAADDVTHAENLHSNHYRCFLIWTHFETESKVPEFSGIVVSARAYQYSTKAPSSFRRLILNSHCSCHGRRPLSAL